MIRSFADKTSEDIFQRIFVKRFSSDVQRVALRKMLHVHAAQVLEDLKVPPGNRLEKLKGRSKDFYSIRVNDQWRIRFRWSEGNAYDVCVVDYHH